MFAQQQLLINGQRQSIYPIRNNVIEATHFEGLKQLLQNKEVIGMGEATHGTHEFFETKISMFQFLVTECHFRVFGIEASYGADLYVNDYVQNGVGNIDVVMKYLDWPWGTEEVRRLVEWIRAYNLGKAGREQISFYGFDVQNVSIGIKYVDHFLLNDSSIFSMAYKQITPLLTTKTELEVLQFINREKAFAKDTLFGIHRKLKEWIDSNASAISEKYGLVEWNRMRIAIENYNQSLRFYYGGNRSLSFRDSCMARNVIEIWKVEKRKMFIWAHNDHIGLEYQKIPIMGSYIKKDLKEEIYAIGFAFDHGSFMAFKGPNTIAGALIRFVFNRKSLYKGLMACNANTSQRNTLTNKLKTPNEPGFFIDVRSTTNTLFTTSQYYYDVGATYLNQKRAPRRIIVRDQFDGLCFFNSTVATSVLHD